MNNKIINFYIIKYKFCFINKIIKFNFIKKNNFK